MSAVELLLEIGTEEIPARFLPDAETNLAQALVKKLNALQLTFQQLKVFSTPRRLTAMVDQLAERQPDRQIEKIGPSIKIAYDDAGQPAAAAAGFAKGQGVDVAELQIIKTEKGEYIGVRKTIPGQPAADLLPEILTEIITGLPWPKSMRWGDLDFRYPRPVHWIVALLGGQVLPITLGGVTAGNRTRGHQYHAPDEFSVRNFADYRDKLRKAKVLLDPQERRDEIRRRLHSFATGLKTRWIEDEELLTQVVYLVEWPAPLLGHIPEKYLELPREVLITPMREHQKYFSFEDLKGKLYPAFCVVANIDSADPATVVNGNQRVLLARLEDAKYFYENDSKKSLDELSKALTGMLYHEKLGSYAEKIARVRLLVNYLGGRVAPKALDHALRAAHIYKSDLLTEMVGEFPELQGVMGRYYARQAGEPEEVAAAIFEHYLPRFAGDRLPETETGAVLSVADKLDSIVACFGVGLQPTGAGDPYALRRQALGVLHILAQRGWNVSLIDLTRKALDGVEDKFKAKRAKLEGEILNFFRDRLFFLVKGQGARADIADAVLAVHIDRVPETLARLKAVENFAQREEFEPFAVAFKRAGNIVKDYTNPGPVDPKLLQEEAEIELHAAVLKIKDQVKKLVLSGDVLGALLVIAGIRPSVDRFFTEVLVMHEDDKIRTNRLNLVSACTQLFAAIADFRKL